MSVNFRFVGLMRCLRSTALIQGSLTCPIGASFLVLAPDSV
jgi:hypothetical protein